MTALIAAVVATPAAAMPGPNGVAGEQGLVSRIADLDWTPRARHRHRTRVVRDCVAGRYRRPWLLRRHEPLALEDRRRGTPDYIYYPEQYFCLYPRYER
jgi:hypothetical protein